MTARSANKLIASLRDEAYGRIAAKLTPTTLEARQVLYRPNQSIGEVYFPESCVICLMTMMHNGDTLETATVGREGARGSPRASERQACRARPSSRLAARHSS